MRTLHTQMEGRMGFQSKNNWELVDARYASIGYSRFSERRLRDSSERSSHLDGQNRFLGESACELWPIPKCLPAASLCSTWRAEMPYLKNRCLSCAFFPQLGWSDCVRPEIWCIWSHMCGYLMKYLMKYLMIAGDIDIWCWQLFDHLVKRSRLSLSIQLLPCCTEASWAWRLSSRIIARHGAKWTSWSSTFEGWCTESPIATIANYHLNQHDYVT